MVTLTDTIAQELEDLLQIDGIDQHAFNPDDKPDLRTSDQPMDWDILGFSVFEAMTLPVMVTDARANIVAVNAAFCSNTGYTLNDVIGKNPRLLQSGRQSDAFYEKMWLSIFTTGSWVGEVWNKSKAGNVCPEWLTIKAMYGENGQVSHYISIFEDLTQSKVYEKELQRVLSHDALTGLPNRTSWMDRLHHALTSAHRAKKMCACIAIDISGFRVINDQYGYAQGDALLQEIGRRLQSCVMEPDVVARMGGNEFAVLMHQIDDVDDAYAVAQKMLIAICSSFSLDGCKINIGSNIGISCFAGDPSVDANHLLQQADSAMLQAREHGCNRIVIAEP